MNTIEFYVLGVLTLVSVLIVLITINTEPVLNRGIDREILLVLLPGAKEIDVIRLDRTRSERGVPMTEGIV